MNSLRGSHSSSQKAFPETTALYAISSIVDDEALHQTASLFEKILGGVMQENKKKWMEICERAADEQDPKKLAVLILQINFILEAKELRLIGEAPTPPRVEDDIANLAL